MAAQCEKLVVMSAQAGLEEHTAKGVIAAQERFADPAQIARLARWHGPRAEWTIRAWKVWLSPDFHLESRCQCIDQCLQALRVNRIQSAAPDMAKEGFRHIAAGLAIDATGDRQPQQGQRIERVARGHLQRNAVAMRQPQYLPVGPVACREFPPGPAGHAAATGSRTEPVGSGPGSCVLAGPRAAADSSRCGSQQLAQGAATHHPDAAVA